MQETIVFLVHVQCRRKESSRSLSHLLMSFLLAMPGPVRLSVCRLSVVCLSCLSSVTFVHHTQAIGIFGTVSTLLGTIEIR